MWPFKKKIGPQKNTLFLVFFCLFLSIFFLISSTIQHKKIMTLQTYIQTASIQINTLSQQIQKQAIAPQWQFQKAVFPIFIEPYNNKEQLNNLFTPQHIGTGFFIQGEKNLAITAKHVVKIKNAKYFTILQNGKKTEVQVKQLLPNTDIALLAIPQVSHNDFYKIPIAIKKPLLNDVIYASGSSLGSYFSKGIITKDLHSITLQKKKQNNVLSINVPMYPSDSGSPVLNTQGELIGIIFATEHTSNSQSWAISSQALNNTSLY
jgi:S1-C subfamily serine protease